MEAPSFKGLDLTSQAVWEHISPKNGINYVNHVISSDYARAVDRRDRRRVVDFPLSTIHSFLRF